MHIQAFLDAQFSAALAAAGAPAGTPAAVRPSAKREFGDYQANGVMGAAKALKLNPRELAQKVVEALGQPGFAEKVEIAGPGFINVHLKPEWLAAQAEAALADARLGIAAASEPQTIVVDYSSPNLAKEMHVGHLRGTIIGDSLVRVLDFLGHKLVRQNHVGDWGTQFGMLIAYMKRLQAQGGDALSMELSNLEVFYREAKKAFDELPGFADTAREYVVKLQSGDAECLHLWQQFIEVSLSHCEEVYQELGILLTREDLMAESAYNDDLDNVIVDLEKQHLLTVDQGARCVFLDEFKGKDDAPLPIIVQKSDGGYLYMTTDLAALRYRNNQLHADRVLYVIDVRQGLHLQQLYTLGHKAGFARPEMKLEHVSYGTVMGTDGKPFKTRSGGTAKLADLIAEGEKRAYEVVKAKNPELPEDELREIGRVVGVSAVKYADLSKSRTSDYIFSWDQMLAFEGNTAPYMLYAYSRVMSVFRRAGLDESALSGEMRLSEPAERYLALKLVQFEEVVRSVAAECYPHYLCAYLFELAGLFMSFYEACPILNAEEAVKQSRLKLALLTAKTLKQGLALLGIETLERM
ncbi:MAG: arginine--tRNA ligase [Gammaproteobacteria bacterium]|nr:arginine--tRNA ligase [Gammaproteobacteria bacterium]